MVIITQIKTTNEIVYEETKCIHNCSLTDGIKRKNKKWIPLEEFREAIEKVKYRYSKCIGGNKVQEATKELGLDR